MRLFNNIIDRFSDDDPLEDFSDYDFNDVLNDLYIIDNLRESGHDFLAEKAYKQFTRHGVKFKTGSPDVANFIEYLTDLQADKNISSVGKTASNHQFDDAQELVRAITIRENIGNISYLSYDMVGKILDLGHGREVNLTPKEYAIFASAAYPNNRIVASKTADLVQEFPIPNVAKVKNIHATKELPKLLSEFKKDGYFSSLYNIENIYAIAPNAQSKNAPYHGDKTIILNTGTPNVSLVKILSGGFKKPSQLAKERGVRMMGQMYGDAVYFARPNQISKNTAYLDRENPGSKFIVVAAIHYNKEIIADNRGGDYRYNGHNMVHAVNVGRYDRDEYMVSPKQVEVKYVLEVREGRPGLRNQIFPENNEKTERQRIENILSGKNRYGRTQEELDKKPKVQAVPLDTSYQKQIDDLFDGPELDLSAFDSSAQVRR